MSNSGAREILRGGYLAGPFLIAAMMAAGAALGTGAPPRKQVSRLEVQPPGIRLVGPQATQRVLVTVALPDGSRRDITDEAAFRVADAKVAVVSPQEATIRPRANGTTAVAVRWNGLTARVPVTVAEANRPFVPSFEADVIPTLSRLGCSQGACHGAQQGKGGFRLSLRGYAPEMDFVTVTRQLGGRRISREAPEQSLLLRKPLMQNTAHRGGKRLDKDSPEYRLLLAWIAQGATGPTGKDAPLTRLVVLPPTRTMRPGQKQRLLVRAVYADGRTEDVTGRALFATNDVAVASVDEDGLVTQQRAGETAILAKYRDKLSVAVFTAPYAQKVSPAAFTAENNYVDRHASAKLRSLNIEPSPLCTDQEFLRRVYVDAIGTLPSEAEARAFLDSRDPKKRDKLIDALLQRPEFGQVWALKFGDLFVLRKEYLGRKNAMILQQWLTEQFNANRPWDKIVTDLLTATGDPYENRAGMFFISRTPQKENEKYWIRKAENTAEMTAQVFLGSRIGCAKCHNHPSEKTTQDDYYRFVALWQQVTGKGERGGVIPERIEATASGDVRHPRSGEVVRPQPLDGTRLTFVKDEDRRLRAVQWMIRRPEFSRSIVNRVWARCFGQGIIEPVDDVRSTNPAKNEPLMQALCRDFVSQGYDLKHLTATILKSRTYQRSAKPVKGNRFDTRYFARYPARRLGAEELVDAVAQVTGVPDKYQQLGLGTRALELADAEIPSLLLDTFGRPPRVMPSDSERTCSPAVSQALALLNSAAIQQKLKASQGVLPDLLKSGKTDAQVIESLFLRALARRPTAAETKALAAAVKTAPGREEGFQDVLWALLNTKDFLFNY